MSRNILIAGGNSGVGLETVKLLREKGGSLFCAVRNPGALGEFGDVKAFPFDAATGIGDVDLPEVIDGFVYLPGTINLKPFHGLKDSDFEHDFGVNVLGAVGLLRKILPSLKRSASASVVLFSTVAVQIGMPFHSSIAAAKGAVEGLTRSLAAEWAPKIRVNCIAPSLTDTPLASNLLNSDQKTEAAHGRHPLGKIGDPADTAELVGFLLGEASKFMTGQVIKADGGLSSVRLF